MAKFFVVCGYCSPDNYTSNDGPVLELLEFDTTKEVEACYKQFKEETRGEASDLVFRIIEGRERKIEPVEKVTEYKLS